MTSITSMEPGTTAERTSAVVECHGVDPDGSGRRSARKTVVATSVVAVIAVLSPVVGMVFPAMFAAAVAITVLALVVALDRVFEGPGQQPAADVLDALTAIPRQRTGDSIFESPVIDGERWYAARGSNPRG